MLKNIVGKKLEKWREAGKEDGKENVFCPNLDKRTGAEPGYSPRSHHTDKHELSACMVNVLRVSYHTIDKLPNR